MTDRVTIDRLGASGDGVARLCTGPVYVAGALPGEIVLVECDRDRGRLVAVEHQSPDRIAPFCPYYGRCGGCVAQHVGPGLYGPWKRGRLVEALARAGLTPPVEPMVDAHGEGRRRVTFHARRLDEATQVGFMEARSHRLVAIDQCPVAAPALARAAPVATALARALAGAGKPLDVVVTATAGGLDVDLRGSGPVEGRRRQELIRLAAEHDLARLSVHGDVLIERRQPVVLVGASRIVLPPGGFLQATARGEEVLAEAVLAGCADAKRVADLFAGSGPFALRLARAAEVHAVEVAAAPLAALDRAARETPGLRRVTTEARDLFRRPLLPPELDRYDAIVLDPPRAGAEAQARQLAASSCRTAILVSCDSETFARDAAILTGSGMSLDRVLPVDQFRWSAHLEMVGTFRRAAKPRRRRLHG